LIDVANFIIEGRDDEKNEKTIDRVVEVKGVDGPLARWLTLYLKSKS